MKVPALLQRAKAEGQPQGEGGASFKRPDVKALTPPAMHDVVDRVAAAGMRYLYSPAMRDDVMAAIEAQEPMPNKLASNVAGLLLTLDQQTKGGIPVQALFPAGLELLGEAADVMVQAGQPVSQEDYNTAALMLMAIIGKKLGAPDDAIAQAMAGEETGEFPEVPEEAEPDEPPESMGEEPMDDEMPENQR